MLDHRTARIAGTRRRAAASRKLSGTPATVTSANLVSESRLTDARANWSPTTTGITCTTYAPNAFGAARLTREPGFATCSRNHIGKPTHTPTQMKHSQTLQSIGGGVYT